jgi:hypothetical protein
MSCFKGGCHNTLNYQSLEEKNMEQPKPKGPQATESLPRVVKIRPGSASESAVKVVLPSEVADGPLEKVVQYVLGNGELTRKDTRIADRLRHEMKGTYGLIVNEGPAKPQDNAAAHYREQVSPGGLKYKQLDIIIAAEQEAGYLR